MRISTILTIVLVAALLAVALGAGYYIAKTPNAVPPGPPPIEPVVTGQVEPSPLTAPPPEDLRSDPVQPFMPDRLDVRMPVGPVLLNNIPLDSQPLQMIREGSLRGWVVPRPNPGLFIDPAISWSVLPGAGTGTTMIFGHAQNDRPEAFNPLTTVNPDTEDVGGFRATLTRGVRGSAGAVELVYANPTVFIIPKGELKNWSGLMTNDPNRLVLVTCNVKMVNGAIVDTYDSVVWVFTLVSSKAGP